LEDMGEFNNLGTRGSQLKKIFVHPHIFNEKYPIRGIGKTKKYILNMKKI
jgi:hypothetical protein